MNRRRRMGKSTHAVIKCQKNPVARKKKGKTE